MNDLKAYSAAYFAAEERAKQPHPESQNDGDGWCCVCGLPWPESEDEGVHLCPPGFHWISPKHERAR